ncbi:MAG: hypothetical protein KDI74_14125 [Gammaproteobacteria bacterium]|nr:hypothetical protein [Gammaproteobacteria bacterium]
MLPSPLIHKLENDDVLRVELAQQGEIRTFYLKRYWSRDFNKIWRRAFRGSLFGPALVEREASNIGQLGSYGVSTPKVAAFGCQRFCGSVTPPPVFSPGVYRVQPSSSRMPSGAMVSSTRSPVLKTDSPYRWV